MNFADLFKKYYTFMSCGFSQIITFWIPFSITSSDSEWFEIFNNIELRYSRISEIFLLTETNT